MHFNMHLGHVCERKISLQSPVYITALLIGCESAYRRDNIDPWMSSSASVLPTGAVLFAILYQEYQDYSAQGAVKSLLTY